MTPRCYCFPPPLVLRFTGPFGWASEHWEDINDLMNNRAALELIVVPGLFDDDEPPTTLEA